jgi:preprotein translocase subunit SecE
MFDKISRYYTEVKSELKKSTWPKAEEVKNTTIIVIITVFIFAFYLYLCDISLTAVIRFMNDFFTGLLA